MLRIDNLEMIIKENLLLKTDYFNLNGGEKAAVIGNNDSGKSLLLKAIHGEYTNFSGGIFIKEKSSIFYKKRKQTILIDTVNRVLENETLWKNITLPLPGLSARTTQKIKQFCATCGLEDQLKEKTGNISLSSLKLMEIIRATIQLPYIILIDDIDMFFDNIKLNSALTVLDYATNNGSCVLVSAKNKMENMDLNYRIQNGELVKL